MKDNHIYNVSQQAFSTLQSLRQLNIRGNRYKNLPSSILFLPSLEKVVVDSARDCESCEINFAPNCSTELRKQLKHIPSFGNVTGLCLAVSCQYLSASCRSRNTSEVPKLKGMDEHQLNFTRYNETNNTRDNVPHHNTSDSSVTPVSLLEQSIILKCFIFILSLSACLTNLIVMEVVLTTPRLKRINALFLAGHIAICDFIVAANLLVVAVNVIILTTGEQRRNSDSWSRYICPTIVFTRSAALLVEPVLLFLMTLDRYKLIVNHSRPSTHLTNRSVFIATCIAWLISAIIVGSQTVGSITGKHNLNGNLCGRERSSESIGVYIEKVGIVTSSVLFVLCCVMYFRIYRVVKNQNLIMGSNTYTRVSKLLFALVISTLVLWYVPAMIVAFVGHTTSATEIRALTIFISLTTNSLVNPFLYVFREKKFRQELFSRCSKCVCTRRTTPNLRRIGVKTMDTATGQQSVNSDKTNGVYSTSL